MGLSQGVRVVAKLKFVLFLVKYRWNGDDWIVSLFGISVLKFCVFGRVLNFALQKKKN